MNNLRFYHGTTDKLLIGDVIRPSSQTGILREDWRDKLLDMVFFTVSLASAEKYAKKAGEKYGGTPVVYEVKPIGQCFHRVDTEYIANAARIICRAK